MSITPCHTPACYRFVGFLIPSALFTHPEEPKSSHDPQVLMVSQGFQSQLCFMVGFKVLTR